MSTQTDTGMRRIGLAARIAGVALLAAASVAAIADQSGRFVGVHEVPPFVCDRVDLVPGRDVDRFAGDFGPGGSDRIVQGEVAFPGSPICARRPGD